MSRALKLVISASYIVFTSVAANAGESGPDCVRRGEYANALSSMHDLDPATRTAYLIMAGDIEKAAEGLGDEGDSLLEAFLRSRLEDWDGVLSVSGSRCLNRYLEIFRLYMRARAFMEKGMPDSVIVITGVLRPGKSQDFPFLEKHQVYEDLIDLRAEAFVRSEREGYSDEAVPETLSRLSRPTLLLTAERALLDGRRGLATGIMEKIRTGGLSDEEIARYDRIINGIIETPGTIDGESLSGYCREAIRAGLESTAGRIMDLLENDPSFKWETAFHRGLLLEKKDRLRQARKKFREIFRSDAAVDLKKESLLRIASIDYRIRHLEDSASNLRLFGVYYPDDRRAESVLDRAARIHVARSRWEEALETWGILGRSGPVTRQGRAGVISRAVLCLIMERRQEARETLRRLLDDGLGLMRDGALYWMHRASDDPDSASMYLETLKKEYPLSIYAYVPGMEAEILRAGTMLADNDLTMMERSERRSGTRPVNGMTAGETGRSGDMVEAFEYFTRNGLLAEAAGCAELLAETSAADADGLWYIYGVLRDRGMIRSSISVLGRLTGLAGRGKVPAELLYPVPYTGIIRASADREKVPVELILSVIREESLFEVDAVSRAGALGLMQLMPSTGRWIGEKIRRTGLETEDMFDPQFNIDAGTWYLRFLLDRSSDSLVGALAAYNAGNAKMSGWRKTYRPWDRPMIAMEMIGLQETREYVRRVLGTYAAYRTLYRAGEGRR